MRQQNLGENPNEKVLTDVFLDKEAAARLHRLFAIGASTRETSSLPSSGRSRSRPDAKAAGGSASW